MKAARHQDEVAITSNDGAYPGWWHSSWTFAESLTFPEGDHMIIDRETFTDIAKYLESASEGLLRAATGVATLCPEMDPGEPASLRWLALIESMVSVNGEITALETVLRAVLEANREEVAAARAGVVREPSC
jgi:hypothetical protein